jgi:hypothetical protein
MLEVSVSKNDVNLETERKLQMPNRRIKLNLHWHFLVSIRKKEKSHQHPLFPVSVLPFSSGPALFRILPLLLYLNCF